MTLKIGLLTGEYPPMEGGVGAFTQELAKALAVLGHEPWIITHREARPEEIPRNFAYHEPVELGYAKLLPWARTWKRGDMQTIAETIERYEIELVNIQYQPAAFNMRNPRINMLPWRLQGLAKSVVTFHDLRTPFLFPKAGRLRQKAVDFMAEKADAVIVTNSADYQQLATSKQQQLHQIPIGSNVTAHTVSAEIIQQTRNSINLNGNDTLLAYFGFLNESKGADTLIDALARLPSSYHLVFIGGQTGASDPTNNSAFLKKLHFQIDAHDLQSRVHWTGFVEDEQVSAWLKSAEITVLPYHDGVSLRRGTLMAALAHGCPILTTPPQRIEIGLDDGTMQFAPPADAGALSQAIATLAADDQKRAALGESAARLASSYSWDKIAAQTAALFQTVLKA